MVIMEEDSLSVSSSSSSKVAGTPNLLRHPADGEVNPSSNLLADGTPSLRNSPLVDGELNLPKPFLMMPTMEDGVLIPLLSSLLPLLSLPLRLFPLPLQLPCQLKLR